MATKKSWPKLEVAPEPGEQVGEKPAVYPKHEYELRNTKTWEGREGYGLRADIYRAGVLVGNVHDDGNGAICYSYRFITPAEQTKFSKYCKPFGMLAESEFVDHLFVIATAKKQLTSWCPKKIVVIDGGKCFTYNGPLVAERFALVKKAKPKATVLNELPFDKALELFTAVYFKE